MSHRNRVIVFITAAVAIVAIAGYFVVSSLLGGSTPSSPRNVAASSSSTRSSNTDSPRVLVVFFSRTQGIYGADLEIGHTHRIANYIQAQTGADQYEIVPAQEYPTDYEETTVVAQEELASNARPEIANPLPDVSNYDVVFVGGPIWWGEYPMVVRTFLDGVDLNGKTVIPFVTHEGSGLGNTKQVLEQQYPNAQVLDGLAVRGTEAAEAEQTVVDWLSGLGI